MTLCQVVFIKASWHVGEPFTSKYSEWLLAHADGRPTTHGSFDEALYRYAVTYVVDFPVFYQRPITGARN